MQTVVEHSVLSNLPVPATPFVGREHELADITRMLADPAHRLVTLVGPGGIGKTRLVLEAAARQQNAFRDGVWFVPLQPLHSSEYVLGAVADTIRLCCSQTGDPGQQILEHLAPKNLLLVMDNFEHLLDASEIVGDILDAAPEIKILVTSREALNLQQEWVWPVSGLAYPDPAILHNGSGVNVEDYGAVQFFVQSAHRTRADFSFDAERAGVLRLCALTEGSPLGLELAASWVRVLSCDEIADRIARNIDFLQTRARNVPARHQSMRAVLDYSWKLLSDEEQTALMRLSVFRGGFTREAAAVVALAPLPVLSTLIDKSLIRHDASGRYDLHEMVRQYAERHLNNHPDDLGETRHRHSGYFMTFLQQRWPDLLGSRPREALHDIETEIANVRTGWGWAVVHRLESDIEKGLDSLWFFYDTRSWYREGEKVFAMAADSLDDLEGEKSLLLAKVLARQGVMCNSLSQYDQARMLLQTALDIARRLDDPQEIAFALTRLGEVVAFEREHTEARPYFAEALPIFESIGARWDAAFVLGWMGNTTNDTEEARRYHAASLALFEELDSQWGIAITLPLLGWSAQDLGHLDEALRMDQEGFRLCQEIGIQWGVAMSLCGLGQVAYEKHDYDQARWCFEQALHIAYDVRLIRFIQLASLGVGAVLRATHEWERARDFFAVALGYLDMKPYSWHRDYLTSTVTPEELDDVRAHLRGKNPAALLKTLLAGLDLPERVQLERPAARGTAAAAGTPSLIDPLTDREREILALVAGGQSNREVADRLFLSTGTVKWYLSQIYNKMGVSSRTQAVARARELHLLEE